MRNGRDPEAGRQARAHVDRGRSSLFARQLEPSGAGSLGHLSALSFHETKNVHCGEGGALVINDSDLIARAEVVQEKGTDRSRFFRGEVDKYTWCDLGSSYLLSEIGAAFLCAQLKHLDEITAERHAIWGEYHRAFEELEEARQAAAPGCSRRVRAQWSPLLPDRSDAGGPGFAYRPPRGGRHRKRVPLRSFARLAGGQALGRAAGDISIAFSVSSRLLRLPLWSGIGEDEYRALIDAVLTHGSKLPARSFEPLGSKTVSAA